MKHTRFKRFRRRKRVRREQMGNGDNYSWLNDNLLSIFDAVQVGMVLVDGNLRVVKANRFMSERFSGISDGRCEGPCVLMYCSGAMAEQPPGIRHAPDCPSCELMVALKRALEEGEASDGNELTLQLGQGENVTHCWMRYNVRPVEFDHVRFALLSLMDITDLKASQHEWHQKALYDPVTTLPNRLLFIDRLESLVASMPRNNPGIVGVMLLDLDNFKTVNDILGHNAGDRLLNIVGRRLRGCLWLKDSVARIGGDSFAVLLSGVRHAVDLATVARKVMVALQAPIHFGGKEFIITASVGIACYPVDSVVPSELLSFADVAMYHAKSLGRNNFQFYRESLANEACARIELEADLRKAIRRGELELFYQPKVDTVIGQMVGAEALLRWRCPGRGMVPPDRFIGIAEDTGLILEIGAWVLRQACRAITGWNREAHYPFKVAVNLSAQQFQDEDFVDMVFSTLAETGCRPEWLELEITESLFLGSHPQITNIFEALKSLGIAMVLDDFGTGYSSLSYLTDFPIKCLKIDKSFVRDITTRPKSLELVRGIVSMGLALGMELVAEGVETGEQAACLDKLGCHVIQGYFYGKPMPAADFDAWRTNFVSSREQVNAEITQLVNSPWRDYLITGNELIDRQHRELFRRVTRLAQACRFGKGQDEVHEMLVFLGDYVKEHFSAEEELLVLANSPQYAEHKQAHHDLTVAIDALVSRLRSDGITLDLTIETNYVAIEWLTNHICGLDRRLAERLRLVGS